MNPEQLLDRFSSHLKNAIAKAISIATSLEHAEVSPMHLLAGIVEQRGSLGAEILQKAGINGQYIMTLIKTKAVGFSHTSTTTQTVVLAVLNSDAKRGLEKAMMLAYEHSNNYIGTEHLLAGLLELEDKTIDRIIKKFEATNERIIDDIHTVLETANQFPEFDDIAGIMDQMDEHIGNHTDEDNEASPRPRTKTNMMKKKIGSALDMFATHLTDPNQINNIDPVIGREHEIERVIHILSRRTKNNPVLIGEPGVGKTAIVEGLAKQIIAGNVPTTLKHKKIYALDLALLVAGTMYRGEFEARLKQIIEEVQQQPNTILFIDEIHNIIGAGSNQGTMDAANMLKPALARGQLRCIGATTIDEYKRHIMSDPAIERRLQSIMVEEPSSEEAYSILKGIKKYYEQYHSVRITDEAIVAAVDLSKKYVHDNHLPDKAIDLIDEASAAVKVAKKQTKHEEAIASLKEAIKKAEKAKTQAITDEQFECAMKHKQTIEKTQKSLKTLLKTPAKKNTRPKIVTRKHIVQVLAQKLHADPSILAMTEGEKLSTLSDTLSKTIVGQSLVIDTVTQALTQRYLGLGKNNKPRASFLFAGPSGVGKTALAVELAKALYHDERACIRLDMSEFAEQHGVSKLLGSPAGYIGHKDRNRFFEQIATRPYSVILFDEIDKAHPDVIRLLLQILDRGTLTDSAGKIIRFDHSIIVLTTNIASSLYRSPGIGFGDFTITHNGKQSRIEDMIQSTLKETFGAELLGRIDRTCSFAPLEKAHVEQIVTMHINTLNERLKEKKRPHILIDASALKGLTDESYDVHTGARNVPSTIERIVHTLLAEQWTNKTKKKKYTLKKQASLYTLV